MFHHTPHVSCSSRPVVKTSLSNQVAAAVIVLDELDAFKKERKERGMWSKNWLLNRQRFSLMNLLNSITNDSRNDNQNYLRMSVESFNMLLDNVKPFITKNDTILQNALSPEERLTTTKVTSAILLHNTLAN